MKRSFVTGLSLIIWALFSLPAIAEETVESLRGSQPLEADSRVASMKKMVNNDEPVQRDYLQQPPLIPHTIRGYKINAKFNKCLSCHSWSNYKEAGATKISQTHFESRDGEVLSNVSARRYFCNQCHVPQANAKPLVDNTFEPVQTMRAD